VGAKDKTNAKLDELKADLQKILSSGKGTNSKGGKSEAVEKLEKNIGNVSNYFFIYKLIFFLFIRLRKNSQLI